MPQSHELPLYIHFVCRAVHRNRKISEMKLSSYTRAAHIHTSVAMLIA